MSGLAQSNGEEIDKSMLYGRFLQSVDDNRAIYNDAVRMALDIPKPPQGLQIQANTTHNYPPEVKKPSGLMTKALIGTALVTGLGGLGLGAASLLREPTETIIESVTPGTDRIFDIIPGETIVE